MILPKETCWRRGSPLFRRGARRLSVYGRDRPIKRVQAPLSGTPVMSQSSLKRCVLRYMALGWTGYVPEDRRQSIILLPINIAPWIWGYPQVDRPNGGRGKPSVYRPL